MNHFETKLLTFATAVGAAWWLAWVVFSRTERRRLDAATQAMDAASFKGADGIGHPSVQ